MRENKFLMYLFIFVLFVSNPPNAWGAEVGNFCMNLTPFALLIAINSTYITLLYALLAIGAAYVAVKMILNRFDLQRLVFAKHDKDRAEVVQRQKAEIIKQSEELQKAYQEIQTKNIAIEEAFHHLSESYAKLRDLGKFKEVTTAMIVHDFKNSLNSVISFSNGVPSEREIRSNNDSGKKMLNLVLNILDVQKFEDTEVQLALSEFFLDDLITKALEQSEFQIDQNNIDIQIDHSNRFLCAVDGELIQRVFSNILVNAIKYSPSNGQIVIRTERKQVVMESVDDAGEMASKDFVQISFTDQGPGIPEKMINKIFDKYVQVAPRKSGGVRSTGLGLAFCKLVVEAHQGTIWAESMDDRGTTFVVQLPLINEEIMEQATQNSTSKDFVLDEYDLSILQPLYTVLQPWEVYDYSEVMDKLDQLDGKNDVVLKWKLAMVKSVQNVNEVEFHRLLSMIRNDR